MSTLHRRAFTLGLSGAALAALLPRRARAGGHRILVIGGSAIKTALGKYIEEAIAGLGNETKRHAKSSSGLSRPDFYDWVAAAGKQRAAFKPDATVAMFGGNDAQALFMGDDAKPKWIRWDDAGWADEYRKRVAAVADALTPNGEHVFLLGMPEMRSSGFDKRMKTMNAIYEAEMATRPNGHFVDTRGRMPGSNGRYVESATIGGKTVELRGEDGIHFAVEGAKILADAVAPEIVAAL